MATSKSWAENNFQRTFKDKIAVPGAESNEGEDTCPARMTHIGSIKMLQFKINITRH